MYKQESDKDVFKKTKTKAVSVGKDMMSLPHLHLCGEGINISLSKCLSICVPHNLKLVPMFTLIKFLYIIIFVCFTYYYLSS